MDKVFHSSIEKVKPYFSFSNLVQLFYPLKTQPYSPYQQYKKDREISIPRSFFLSEPIRKIAFRLLYYCMIIFCLSVSLFVSALII